MTAVSVPREALPSRKLRVTLLWLLAILSVLCFLLWYLDLSPSSFMVDFRFIADLGRQMFPPNFSIYWSKDTLLVSLFETLSMAFLATVCGGAISLFLAFLAASNTTPHPLFRLFVRSLLALNRSVPNLVVILVLLAAVGIGPFAGVLALIFGSVGMFARFFADAIEQADRGTVESVESLGSTRMQTIRFGLLPQVIPSFVANLFYSFDYNLRAAIPLGVFGGGGIGFEIQFADGMLHYKDVVAYTILIVIMITVMERISDWVRRSILTQPAYNAK
jgi:phosphonate transport system permease protein